MPKRIRDLPALTPATGDHVVIDRPSGATGKASISADPTPNTLALRNAQGALRDGAFDGEHKVLRMGGIYLWGAPNKWLRIASWTGFSGLWKGLFADLTITRVANETLQARLRVSLGTNGSGVLGAPLISLAIDRYRIVENVALIQTAASMIELWALFPWGNVYVSGVIGSSAGTLVPTPYGDVSSIVQDSPPNPISGGVYLKWDATSADQTFPGPGYITAAARNPSSGYIRYDNGIQIVWGTVSISSGTWVFPAAFASPPRVVATAEAPGAPRVVTITSVSTTGAGLLRTDLSGNTIAGNIHVWGIGLWK